MMPRVRFTSHALDKMEEREITPDEIAAVVASPRNVTVGETAVEYDGVANGRSLHMIIVRNSDPPLVITAWGPPD